MLTQHVAGRVYNYDYCIGRGAGQGMGFSQAMDFAMGAERGVYIVSRGTEFNPSQGISKITLDHDLVWDDRGLGYGGGSSPWPVSVDVDSAESVYISDDHVSQIFVYDREGNFSGKWGTRGSRDGELNGPSGLAFDKEDNLYVVDSLNNRVQKFSKDGKYLAQFGSQGRAPGQFTMPWGIAIDSQGDVYVADWKNDRVQKFSPDGRHLATFGPGSGEGELQRPTGVAIDDEGDVYVADWGNNQLKIFASDGTHITTFVGDAERLSPWSQATVDANPDYQKARKRVDLSPEYRFHRPIAVNVNSDGQIMVLDQQRNRIQVYVKKKDYVDAQFNL